jgi:glucose/mannose-6-phosphate isomerase
LLDDLKIIHERDKSDALGLIFKQPVQLQHKFDVAGLEKFGDINNIVVAGMGGSGWPAHYLAIWPTLPVPLSLVSDYDLPTYVGKNTLVIAASYSGNTEETISALQQAKTRTDKIVVMSSGGKLAEMAGEAGLPYYALPTGGQPRMQTFYFLAAYLDLFVKTGLCTEEKLAELHQAADWLAGQIDSWLPTTPTSQNQAKQLSQELVGRSVVVYAGSKLAPVARKWKICLNENAKQVAWWNQFPEFSHNEFIGWTKQPVDKPYAVVDLRSNLEHPRIQKRFEITEQMLSGLRPSPEVVEVKGDTILQQVLWASVLGDFVSVYLAILNNVDPTPVELVEKFKHALG